jgi:ribulose-5-phosphate 4-epimerase/fuculose-1-phosphate aldolase
MDPGPPLARMVREKTLAYVLQWGAPPKVILMQNHGMIALGYRARDVINITAMATKAARVLLGTCALGGPSFLAQEHAGRIHSRPDEKYRQSVLARE